MKSKVIKIGVALFILITAFFVSKSFFTVNPVRMQALSTSVKLKLYQGKNPPYDFTFEYPEIWKKTERGYSGDYDMVEVMGSVDKNPLFIPGIFITKRSHKENDTLTGIMGVWIKEESRYSNFKILDSKSVFVAGVEGLETRYRYTLSLPPWAVSSQEVGVIKRQMVFIRGEATYQLTFSGTEEQQAIYQPVFDHVLKTFRFVGQ